MVMATQNPVENVGTYPLPEAQMDRFMMRISIGYPSVEEEMEIISTNAMRRIQKDVNVVAEKEVISWLREQIPQVEVTEEVKRYMLDITRKTREEDLIELGVSPRAGQMLFSAAQTLALLNGRSYVVPEDVQALVHDVLDHRIILKPQSRGRGITTHEVIADIVNNTVVPR